VSLHPLPQKKGTRFFLVHYIQTWHTQIPKAHDNSRGIILGRVIRLSLTLAFCILTALGVRWILNLGDFNGSTLVDLGLLSLNLEYTVNTGINFGLAGEATTSRQLLLAGVALLVCALIIAWGIRSHSRWSIAIAGTFAGGGIANAYERLAYGGVFDYLNVSSSLYANPFSFNLADVYIFAGLVMYIARPNTVRH